MAITRIGNPAIAEVREPNFRNIIINGDMSIAQRGTSETGLGNGDNGYHTCDRWRFFESGAPTAEFTMSQSTDVPSGQGFATSLKLDCTTAQTSLASSDVIRIEQRIEGQNLQYLKKGTSNAESVTCSFWVKSSKTGTFIVELNDSDNLRQISKSYTINSANTWEKKTITYDGDTTGTLDNDNANSIRFEMFLLAGTDFTSGTLATSWQANDNADRAVGQVNLADSTSNEWYITGVQLEAGEVASDFEFLPVDVNLQRCQRYCYSEVSGDTYHAILNGFINSSTLFIGVLNLPTSMRTNPSLTTTGSWQVIRSPGYSISAFSLSDNAIDNINSVQIRATISGAPTGDGSVIRNNNDSSATFILSSEL